MPTAQRTRQRNASPLSILLIEDDLADARVVETNLRKRGFGPFHLRREQRLVDGITAVNEDAFDVVLLDLGLPDGRGLTNVEKVMACPKQVPVIVLTGNEDERDAIEAVRLGAQDYLVKGDFTAKSLHDSIRFATERDRLLREVEAAQRREGEVKDRLLSHVSHELRTPLTAIMQFVTILRDGIAGGVSAQQAEYLDIVLRNTEQLKHMISTLMDVTRANSGKLTCDLRRTKIVPIVGRAVDSLRAQAAKKGVQLELGALRDLPRVVADEHRIEQVLVNLLENAIKFTPENGTVAVDARAVGDELVVAVSDTGCGIAAEDIGQVFERLYQAEHRADTSRNGLGLGLHICQEIVAMHNGRIWAESAAGQGSRFLFALPTWSLESFVRRVAVVDGACESGVGLVTLSVRPVTSAAHAKGVDAAGAPAVQLLERCMLGLSDVVLPLTDVASTVTASGVARTAEPGIAAIANRVRAEFDRDPRLGRAGFEATVRCRWFAIENPAQLGIDEALIRTAREINAELSEIEGGVVR